MYIRADDQYFTVKLFEAYDECCDNVDHGVIPGHGVPLYLKYGFYGRGRLWNAHCAGIFIFSSRKVSYAYTC